MTVVAIVGSGPKELLPELTKYLNEVDVWIGVDRGAIELVNRKITMDYAVGDFDSVTTSQKEKILKNALRLDEYSSKKDQTDLEIALQKAYDVKANEIYFFGITGGRLDHGLINIQLLHTVMKKGISGKIIDRCNQLKLMKPGTHSILKNKKYCYISFVPFTKYVQGISLFGFKYSLNNEDAEWGMTKFISNSLKAETGTISFEKGLLLFIQSRDKDAK